MTEKTDEKRQVDRIASLPVPDLRLHIQGAVRELLNISDNGFGILIDTPERFHLGQRLDDIRLEIEGDAHQLHGAVAHITRTINGHVLGIRLELNSIEEYRVIADLKKRCSNSTQ